MRCVQMMEHEAFKDSTVSRDSSKMKARQRNTINSYSYLGFARSFCYGISLLPHTWLLSFACCSSRQSTQTSPGVCIRSPMWQPQQTQPVERSSPRGTMYGWWMTGSNDHDCRNKSRSPAGQEPEHVSSIIPSSAPYVPGGQKIAFPSLQ